MKWSGAVTLVTGASRGIGRSVAIAAARRGAKVGLVARSEADLDTVADAVRSAGSEAAVASADVADREQIARAVAAVEAALGPLDVVVANAGIGAYGAFLDADLDEVERLMRVNYLGTVYTLAAALPGMVERRRGHVVVMASVAGRIGAPFEAAYSASKFAQVGLTEALSVELAPFGIGVSMVNPGPVETDFFDARGHAYERKSPKPVSADAVAAAVMAAVEKNRLEQYVPRWLRQASLARHLLPPIYRVGTRATFRRELAEEEGKR